MSWLCRWLHRDASGGRLRATAFTVKDSIKCDWGTHTPQTATQMALSFCSRSMRDQLNQFSASIHLQNRFSIKRQS